jgi:hypothetical protein
VFDWKTEPVTENSLLICDPIWLNPHELTEAQIESTKKVKNKKILLILDYKSFYINNYYLIDNIKKYLQEMNFSLSEVYIILQLEYDVQMIKNSMPEINAVSRDRWLKELFNMQITPYTFGKYSGHDDETLDSARIPNKRFSLFIRRHEHHRFEFMCNLLALGLENQIHYTFANTQSSMTHEQFKESIPSRLDYARNILEPWIENIPYSVESISDTYEHMHYPFNLKYYFKKSDINIVLETEPNTPKGHDCSSYLTEKTYKAIMFKKPFILVSAQHALKSLRAFGFKTFSPWVDESYDDIEDFDLRTEAISAEIKRLSLLSDSEMSNILQEINDIIEHNYKLLFELAHTPLPDQFKLKSLLTF